MYAGDPHRVAMSIVHLQNVEIINSQARFSGTLRINDTDPYIFKVTFECISPLEDGTRVTLTADIEWKLIYVGSAESEEYDQELDSCMVGPVPVGMSAKLIQASIRSNLKQRHRRPKRSPRPTCWA